MEEGALGFLLAYEFLDVVDDERVDALVELDELVDFAAQCGRRELVLKQTRCNIKYACARVALLDAYADGLDEVGFAHTAGAEDEERVESLELGVVGNGLAD